MKLSAAREVGHTPQSVESGSRPPRQRVTASTGAIAPFAFCAEAPVVRNPMLPKKGSASDLQPSLSCVFVRIPWIWSLFVMGGAPGLGSGSRSSRFVGAKAISSSF
jgi:hypothetical protein